MTTALLRDSKNFGFVAISLARAKSNRGISLKAAGSCAVFGGEEIWKVSACMLGNTGTHLTKPLTNSSRAFCKKEAFLLNSKLCPPPGSNLASSLGVLVNNPAA